MTTEARLPAWMYEYTISNYVTPTPPPPPKDPSEIPVIVDPHQYPFTWKPYQLYRYYAQVKASEGFDVDPVPGAAMYGSIGPMDHLGADKKSTERMARLAVDEYNHRYKDERGELLFGKVIKAMGKAVNGIMYYLTVEAKDLRTGMPVTFQAVTFIGIRLHEVQSFRFISDSEKEPWLWTDHLCSCWHD